MDLCNPSATTYKMQLQEPTKMLCNFLHFYCAMNTGQLFFHKYIELPLPISLCVHLAAIIVPYMFLS